MNENLLTLFNELYNKSKIRLVKNGFHSPLAFLIERNKTEGRFSVQIVPLNFDDLDKKQQTFKLLGEELQTGKYQGYVMITEGWIVMVDRTKNTPEEIERITKIPPSKNPNRKECVFVRVQDEFGDIKSNVLIFEKDNSLISEDNPKGIKIIKEQKDNDNDEKPKELGSIKEIWR